MIARAFVILALLSTSGALAQMPALRGAAAPNGITVTGRGTVAAVPDRARITVQISGGVTATGNATLDDAVKALIDAMHDNGIADAHEAIPIGTLGTRNVVIAVVGTVAKPTRDKLETMARNVVKAIPDRYTTAFANTQIQTALVIDDCDPVEARAERAAYADAKARASRVASAAGVRLGNVVAIGDNQTILPPSCTTKPDATEANQGGFPYYVGYGPVVVPIGVTETVQFAIAGP